MVESGVGVVDVFLQGVVVGLFVFGLFSVLAFFVLSNCVFGCFIGVGVVVVAVVSAEVYLFVLFVGLFSELVFG
jgi:hypothetical protein